MGGKSHEKKVRTLQEKRPHIYEKKSGNNMRKKSQVYEKES